MSVKIIIDSTADLMPAVMARCKVVPLTVHFGEEEYIDGVTISHKEFYEKLVETDVMPSTSQANPEAFDKVFREVAADGDSAVVITIASGLSGTCQSANIAAADYENIYVVDSGTAAIGAGILAEYALQLADEGKDAAAIAAELDAVKGKIHVIALVDTLEYLCKGGRLSKTAAVAGGILNIKPVLAINQGEIKVLGKARGSRQANNLLASEIEKAKIKLFSLVNFLILENTFFLFLSSTTLHPLSFCFKKLTKLIIPPPTAINAIKFLTQIDVEILTTIFNQDNIISI